MSKGTFIYIGGFELPDKNAAAQRVLSNAKVLRDIGYEIIFIGTNKLLNRNDNILETHHVIEGFDCFSVPYPNKSIEWIDYLSNTNNVEKIVKKYDNVKGIIAYNYPSISLLKLRKFSKKNDIKLIGDCTEWYSTKGSPIIFKIIKGMDSILRMRYAQKRMDGLIVISQYLEGFYQDSMDVITIPPLVDLGDEKWNQNLDKRESNELIITYSGSPGKNKDKLNKLVEALYINEQITNYKINIVGLTLEEYLEYYPTDSKKLEVLYDRIKFLGRQSHKDSLKILQNSDFSVFIRENNRLTNAGFPTKLVESLSCGIPVITTKTSDIGNYLIDGFNGFFLDENSENLALKTKGILHLSRNEVKKLKENSENYSKFHYENYKEEFEEFLKKVL